MKLLASQFTLRHHSTRISKPLAIKEVFRTRIMSTEHGGQNKEKIMFGNFEVTTQVFLTTPHSFALVNLKPLQKGHVLVCPKLPHKRLTDLTTPEVTDLFTTVQRVQRMLARHCFVPPATASPQSSPSGSGADAAGAGEGEGGAGSSRIKRNEGKGEDVDQQQQDYISRGSFNVALQDGPEAGQTVPHVHVHIIPRLPAAAGSSSGGDEIYEKMAGEEGNVGGALWDRDRARETAATEDKEGGFSRRPEPGGQFDRIEDSARVARSLEEMEAEAEVFRRELTELEGGEERGERERGEGGDE